MLRLVRWLFGLAVMATLAWGGMWFAGARGLDMALTRVLTHPRAPLTAADHVVRGFPNRFDITLSEPRLREGDLAWSAPFVQVFALSYRPHHVIVVFPPDQQLTLAGQTAQIATEDARASFVMMPTANLALDRAVLVARMPAMMVNGHRVSADVLRAALRSGRDDRYDAVIEIEAGFPDPGLMAQIDPDGHLPRRFDILRLDAELRFDRPLDLDALRGTPPQLAEAALTLVRVVFDGIDLQVSGRVSLDAFRKPAGALTLSVTGWEALTDRLASAGVLSPEVLVWVRATAPGLVRAGNPEVLEIPLRLEDGQLRLGPLVLAELPTL